MGQHWRRVGGKVSNRSLGRVIKGTSVSNAPASWGKLIAKALAKVSRSFVAYYMDDIVIYSSTPEKHLIHIAVVLQALIDAGLLVRMDKCLFFRDFVDFLGLRLSARGVSIIPEYISAIINCPLVSTKRETMAFLGSVNYYADFIHDLSEKARPLHEILRLKIHEDEYIVLDPPRKAEVKQSMDTLKQALTSPPILTYADFASPAPFILDCDYSAQYHTIGCVLSQQQPAYSGCERPIRFCSKALPKSRLAYSPNKGELYSTIYFIEKLRFYTQLRPFILRVDCSALTWLNNQRQYPKGMILRWLNVLASYNFTVQHRPRRQHANADAMTRVANASFCSDDEYDDDDGAIQQLTDAGDSAQPAKRRRGRPPKSTATTTTRQKRSPKASKGSLDCPLCTSKCKTADELSYHIAVSHTKTTSLSYQDWLHLQKMSHKDIAAAREAALPDLSQVTKQPVCIEGLESAAVAARPTSPISPSAKVSESGIVTYNLRSWAALQRQDLTLAQVIDTLEGKTIDKPISLRAQGLLALGTLFIDQDGVLRYNFSKAGPVRPLILVPHIFQIGILLFFHQHYGCVHRDETIRQAMRHVYFQNMHDVFPAMKLQCKPCQLQAPHLPPNDFLLISHRYVAPFHSLSLDHIGPLYPEVNGYKYILACKCLFSNWVELLPCKSTSAQEVTSLLASEVFCRYSLPACIIADRGSAFTSQEMQEMCHLLGIELRFTSAFNHRANPVERSNRDWKARTTHFMRQSELVNDRNKHVCHLCGLQLPSAKALVSHLKSQHEPEEEPPAAVDSDVKEDVKVALNDAKEAHRSDNWVKLLPAVLFTMRTAVSSTRGASPFQIVFGREPTSSLDLLFGGLHHRVSKSGDDGASYLLERSRQEEAADLFARTHLHAAIQRRREDYQGVMRSFKPDDKVYLFTPRPVKDLSRKFHHFWSGPFIVQEKIAPTTYKIAPAPGVFSRKIDPIVTQVDRLKVYTECDDIISPPANLHLGIKPNDEAATKVDPVDLVNAELKKLIPTETTLPPIPPWQPQQPSTTSATSAASRPLATDAAAQKKVPLNDYPTHVLGKQAAAMRKAKFSGLPPPMATRAAKRTAAAAASESSLATISALSFPSDQDLRDAYARCDSLSDPPRTDDVYHYHRLASLDIANNSLPEGRFKHMIRGDCYNGLVYINSFSVTNDEKGIRTLSMCK